MSVTSLEAAGASAPDGRVRTAWRDDLIAALTGFLLIFGLFMDGWNHLNLQNGKAGEFVTPWHAVLYAGFNACAVWAITRNERLRSMMFPSRGKRGGAGGAHAARPSLNATGLAMIGLVLVGAGLAGDALTRSTGLRASGGAMAPPFDFLLFTGAGLVFAIGLRAVLGQVSAEHRRIALPATLALGAAGAALFAFGGGSATSTTAHGSGPAVSETPGVAQVQSAPAAVSARAHAPARVAQASAPAQHARSAAQAPTVTPVVVNSGPIKVSQTPSALPTTHGPSAISRSVAPSRPVAVQRRAAAPVRRQSSAPAAAPKQAHRVWTSEAVPNAPTQTSVSSTTTTTTTVPDSPTPANAPKPSSSPVSASPTPASSPTPAQAPANGGHQGPH